MSRPVDAAYATHPGRQPDKQVNEDAGRHGVVPTGYLAVVCDGMGGHAGGKEAANLAVDTIFERMSAPPTVAAGVRPPTSREQLRRAIEAANDAVHAMEPAEPGARPGATCVAVLLDAEGAHVAHVGDSRVYHVKPGLALQVTRDHSVVQELVSRGLLTPEQAANHPKANEVTRALGVVPTVAVDLALAPFAFEAGEAFVLATDGMTDVLGPDEILAIVGRGGDLAPLAEELVRRAVERSGHDNTTALVVRPSWASAPAREGAATVVQTVVDAPLGAARTQAASQVAPGGTQVTPAHAAPPTQASATTTERPPRGTVPLEPLAPRPGPSGAALPAGAVGAAVPPAPVSRPRARSGVGPIVGVAIAAVVVVAVVAAIVVASLTSRRGAHHAPASPLDLGEAGAAPPGSASLDDEPLAPSAPAPTHAPAPPLDDRPEGGAGLRGGRPGRGPHAPPAVTPAPTPTPAPGSPGY